MPSPKSFNYFFPAFLITSVIAFFEYLVIAWFLAFDAPDDPPADNTNAPISTTEKALLTQLVAFY